MRGSDVVLCPGLTNTHIEYGHVSATRSFQSSNSKPADEGSVQHNPNTLSLLTYVSASEGSALSDDRSRSSTG